MKLCPEVAIGLRRLCNQSLITDECFLKLLQSAALVLSEPKNSRQTDLNSLCTSKGDIVKESFSALLILVVESARHNLESSALCSVLESYNINNVRLTNIAKLYNEYKNPFQKSLKCIGSSYPKIVDIQWRLDYCIKSSNLEHESQPQFFIQIVTEESSGSRGGEVVLKKINFICTLQELQELVGRVKEIVRFIQSVGNVK